MKKLMKKRLLSTLLALCMMLTLLPGTAWASKNAAGQTLSTLTFLFTDVPSNAWYRSAVQYVYENGMMVGTSSTEFSPDIPTSRGMIVTILHRMEDTPSAAGTAFADVPLGKWYTDAVAWASANNIVKGYDNGDFGPDDPITREQLATILYRYADFKGYDTNTTASAVTFSDGKQVSSWANVAVNWAVGVGLLQGGGNNMLFPANGAARAQAATILMRFCENIVSIDVEKYYENRSELIDIVEVEESNDVLTEKQVLSALANRGFGQQLDVNGNLIGYPVTYDYSPSGDYVDETEVSAGSTDKHPMYQTFYVSEDEEGNKIGWVIYVINGEVFASPVSFMLETTCDKEILLTEDKNGKFTGYYDGKFYITIPYETAVTAVTVDKLDAETLDGITFDVLCALSGATRLASAEIGSGEDELAVAALVDESNVAALSTTSTARADETAVIVSLGDSYSAGEGIEDFIHQDWSWPEKVNDYDFLAHRSENAWPRLLVVPSDRDARSYKNVELHFVAVSGAVTANIDREKQKKDYFKIFRSIANPQISGTKCMPVQLDIFEEINGKDVDFVTLTIGGNDLQFAEIITKCAMESSYLHLGDISSLENKLNELWDDIDTNMSDMKRVYRAIEGQAPYAAIMVAGYPKLLDKHGKGTLITRQEATLVNNAVSAFNTKIKELVNECWESGMNIYFVDVEAKFDEDDGHQAYSKNAVGEDAAWLNPIWLLQSEDLNDWEIASAYSIHPNKDGAQAYADCVNVEIADYWESGEFGKNLYWEFDITTDTLTISGTGEMPDYRFGTVGQQQLPWYRFMHRITEVIIEDGVTSIGSYAFAEFSKLKNVEIGNSVSRIGECAFLHCDKLSTVTALPESLSNVGPGAFYGTALTELYFSSEPPAAREATPREGAASFAYGTKGDTDKITLYYPVDRQNKWDPDGDGKWKGYHVEPAAIVVSGTVYDRETNERVKNALIQITKQGDEKVYEAVSDANGNFTVNIPGLDPVTLIIEISAEGYESQTLHQTSDTRGLQLVIHLAPLELEDVRVKQVSLNYYRSATITEDGSLYIWGYNNHGEIGNGTAKDSSTPVKIMDNVAYVSLGDWHSAAITEDSSLYMWGVNSNGQCGIDTIKNSSTPIKIMDNVAHVSLGSSFSAAITTDDSLYTWGYNWDGRLGNGTTTDSSTPIKIMDNVAYVSLGDSYGAAITTDGSLYMWGAGELGIDTTKNSSTPIKIMDNVAYVSIGSNHSAAITTDGSLYMWGKNWYGGLGNGTTKNSNTPIKIMENVSDVSIGDWHSAAITTDGSLYMWGYNNHGQLGNGKGGLIARTNTIPIKIMDNVADVSIGDEHSAAITTDGSFYTWGYNEYGQLGNGTNEDSYTPIKIKLPGT